MAKDYKAAMEAVLKEFGGLYEFADIIERIRDGRMQSFAHGQTWVVTQVHIFPRRKVLDIVLVVGDIEEAKILEDRVRDFANEIEATLITAHGRPGWFKMKSPGWKRVAASFMLDLSGP